MSGSLIPVCGLRLSITVGETYTDPLVCSVLYRVAGHISNADVRNTLQEILGLDNPSALPPATVKSNNDPNSDAKDYTISNKLLQVYIPFSEDAPGINDVLDSAICLAIATWSTLTDPLRTSVIAAAMLGLQTIAQHLPQDAAQFFS